MVAPCRLIFILLCSFLLLASHVFAYPTDGGIPRSDELQRWLEKRDLSVEEDVSHNSTLVDRDLKSCLSALKSLCCFGRTSGDSGTQTAWQCSSAWPTLEDLKAKISQQGNAGNKISFFYTGLGGAGGIKLAGQWGTCHTNYVPNPPGFTTWDDMVDQGWFKAQGATLAAVYGVNGMDPFLKLLAQAFAESSAGDVYVFTPEENDLQNPVPNAREKVAWVGWEYPALTRNSAVRDIYRVDPRTGHDNDRHLIWSQGDGESQYPPLGLFNAASPP